MSTDRSGGRAVFCPEEECGGRVEVRVRSREEEKEGIPTGGWLQLWGRPRSFQGPFQAYAVLEGRWCWHHCSTREQARQAG